MRPTLHLTFDGRCDAAFAFYARVLGGTVGFMLRDDQTSKIVHGSVAIGGVTLAGADVPPEQYVKPQGFFVLLNVATPDEARRTFDALAAEILMPLQATFWSPSFGALVDQFGVPWEISCEGAP